MSLNTPVIFIIFNRPDLTQIVFDAIRKAQPKQLFVIADGPRSPEEAEKCQQSRNIIEQVDWDCKVEKNYSDVNLGCRDRVSSGITWVFEQVEEAIILEDDCLPAPSFFSFCQTLLDYYRNDTRIIGISGNNFQRENKERYSYYFSQFNHCWGWATWRRAWKYWDFSKDKWLKFKSEGLINNVFDTPDECDYWASIFDQVFLENKINSWNYIWLFSYLAQGGLSILPSQNLVSNIGFRDDGTHTTDNNNNLAKLPISDIWQIEHPVFVVKNKNADSYTFNNILNPKVDEREFLVFDRLAILVKKNIKNSISMTIQGVKFLWLFTYSIYLYVFFNNRLIGKEFDLHGKIISFIIIVKNKDIRRFVLWFCNPVSIVRYFEFPFCHQAIDWNTVHEYLDVSSPRLFFLYLINHYSDLKVNAINPDKNDLDETDNIVNILGLSNRINLKSENALSLNYPDNHFDVITSISVIEHIPDDGDLLAIKELWRVLKPQGRLIITVPCMAQYQEEWRDEDVYQLENPQKNQKYFFQRFYDQATLYSRIINIIQCEPKIIQVFGEKRAGTFLQYEQRWIKYGLEETVKDPWYIVRDYQMFPSVKDLPGMGVCGLVFEKEDFNDV